MRILRDDALRDTGVRGTFKTLPMDLKESAWEALLSHGDRAAVSETAFEEAVGSETSPFIRDKITDFLACFRLDPLPQTAVRWVVERTDIDRETPADELVFAPRQRGFFAAPPPGKHSRILLRFGFTMGGKVPRRSADAVIEVALTLAGQGDLTIGPELADVAIRGGDRNNRVVAVESLAQLAVRGLIPTEVCEGLSETLGDASRDDYERSRIVEALGLLPREFIWPELERQLATWAGGRDEFARGLWRPSLARAACSRTMTYSASGSAFDLSANARDRNPTTMDVGSTGIVLGFSTSTIPNSSSMLSARS